jgi:hypothetical protein
MAITPAERVGPEVGLRCESQLRVAAVLLSRARPGAISATTVVGRLGRDDPAAFHIVAAGIGDELDLDTQTRIRGGSFSVRFSRRVRSG